MGLCSVRQRRAPRVHGVRRAEGGTAALVREGGREGDEGTLEALFASHPRKVKRVTDHAEESSIHEDAIRNAGAPPPSGQTALWCCSEILRTP